MLKTISNEETVKIGVVKVNATAITIIKELASQVRPADATDTLETVRECMDIVHSSIKYDLKEATQLDLDVALKNKKGVCKHLAVALHEVLKEHGIQSEIVIGSTIAIGNIALVTGTHSWVKLEIEGRKYLADPTTKIFGEYDSFSIKSKVEPSLLEQCTLPKWHRERWVITNNERILWDWNATEIEHFEATDAMKQAAKKVEEIKDDLINAVKSRRNSPIIKRFTMRSLRRFEYPYNIEIAKLESLVLQALKLER